MPKLVFSKIRFRELKDLMQNVKRPRRWVKIWTRTVEFVCLVFKYYTIPVWSTTFNLVSSLDSILFWVGKHTRTSWYKKCPTKSIVQNLGNEFWCTTKKKQELSLSMWFKSFVIMRETLTSLAVGGQTTNSTQHWKNRCTIKVTNI